MWPKQPMNGRCGYSRMFAVVPGEVYWRGPGSQVVGEGGLCLPLEFLLLLLFPYTELSSRGTLLVQLCCFGFPRGYSVQNLKWFAWDFSSCPGLGWQRLVYNARAAQTALGCFRERWCGQPGWKLIPFPKECVERMSWRAMDELFFLAAVSELLLLSAWSPCL